MTPKEKALKMCQSFGLTTLFAQDCNGGTTLPLSIAKRCALIAVDELIEEHTWKNPINWNVVRKRFWEEVKSEIEKL
jgi:hypothetical protein